MLKQEANFDVKDSLGWSPLKHAEVFDIVNPDSQQSCCFTKAYGKYAEGTGSILHQSDDGNITDIFKAVSTTVNGDERLKLLKTLKLRYFSPYEVAKLLGFPSDTFTFPPAYLPKPHLCYRVLGNSLNVSVVSLLATILLIKR